MKIQALVLAALAVAGSLAPTAAHAAAEPAATPGACAQGALPAGALVDICVPSSGWNGDLVIGITTDRLLLPDARRFGDELVAVLGELGAQPQARASSSSSRTSGSSS